MKLIYKNNCSFPPFSQCSVEGVRLVKKLTSALKLSGFVDISEVYTYSLIDEELGLDEEPLSVLQVEVSEDSGLLTHLQQNGVTVGDPAAISLASVCILAHLPACCLLCLLCTCFDS